MAKTIDYTVDVQSETLTCKSCGIPFAVPSAWIEARLADHATWYCPNGHNWHYPGKTEQEKRIEALEAENKQAWEYAQRSSEQADAARRSAAALKGVVTRTKNRLAAGTCPCCDKHFKTLAKHMAAEHPEYATTDESDPASS